MKILHILDHSIPLHDGYSFRSQNIIRMQRKWGWDPVVLTSPKHEKSWKGPWRRLEEMEGIRYYRTGNIPDAVNKVVSEIRIVGALLKRLWQVVRKENPDILHVHSPVLNLIPALLISRLTQIPVVYEIRAFWEDAGVDQGTYMQGGMKYNVVRAMETYAARMSNHICVICNGLKKDLVDRGISPKKISILYNGIDVEELKPCDPDFEYKQSWQLEGKTVVGFIGSFYRYEGLDLLINAFHQLSQKRDDVVLLLVGGGEMADHLREEVTRMGLQKKVIMPGRIPHQRISGVYSLVDIFVYPRYSVRLTEIVTPLKPLEAMAMKKAVLASDVGGHRELILNGRTGLLFRAGNVGSLTESLEELVRNANLRSHIQEQGYQRVRTIHSWEHTLSPYAAIYHTA